MVNRLLTEDQVKQYLNIPDFRHISKDKLVQFVSAIPDMDRDVAIKIIEQFPEFTSCATMMVEHYTTACDTIIGANGDSVRYVMEGYKQTLDVLGDLARMEKLEPAERRYFAEKMVEVADKMAAFDANNKNFLAGVTKCLTWLVGGTIILGAAILGVRIRGAGSKIPKL